MYTANKRLFRGWSV